MTADLVVYQFSRTKVEGGDFGHFLSLYAPNRLPAGQPLKTMMGRMIFCIEGYDRDPREVYLIDEIRQFYRDFHSTWPYWLYFCDLTQDGLKTMVICCLSSLTALKVDGQVNCAVEYDRLELARFMALDFPHMNWMCERAGMSEREIFERTREVFHYFTLPFEAEKPKA